MTALAAPPVFSPDDLIRLRRVTAVTPHPNGDRSVAVVERLDAEQAKLLSDLWLVPHDGSPATRMTRGEWRDRSPVFLPDGSLLFASDRPHPDAKGDDPRTQVWALPPTGEAYPLTDEPLGVADFKVAGATLALLTEVLPDLAHDQQRKRHTDRKKHGPSILRYAAQPARYWDHWLGPGTPHLVAYDLTLDPSERRLLASNRRDLTPDAGDALVETSRDLSSDGRQVAIGWASINPVDRIHDRSIAIVDTASGARRELGRGPGLVHAAPRFAPSGAGGTWLVAQRYQRTADGYAHRSLWRYELAGHAAVDLTGAWDRWPAPWAVVGTVAGASQIVATAEDLARTPLFLIDPTTGVETRVGPADGSWDFVAAVPASASAGPAVVGVRSTLLSPPDLAHLDLSTGVLTPLARLSGFSLDPASVARVTDLTVPVADRADGTPRSLHAFLVEPLADGRPTAGNGRTLFWIHGGPVASWSDHWHWRWSSLAMAARGYRVVLPNPSGSTGFGMAWVNDIWGNTWGGLCFDDLMRTVSHLEAHHGLLARDMVAMGGSFGGYMTNWIGGQTDRFRLLVTHASLFDLTAFHGVTDVPAWWELMMGDHPWSGRDFDRYSPHRFVSRWRTPTLILHGERDYRVPIGEGLALFEALQRYGVPSELAVFPDENHWILKPKNIVAWYEAVLDFLDRRWDPANPSAPE